MSDNKPIIWITKNGKHVPLQDNKYASKRIAAYNSEVQEKQIAANKKQSEDAKQQTLPKQLHLPNIKAEDANKTTDVLNLRTKKRYTFKDGTEITGVYAFAGKGCLKKFRDAQKYADKYRKLGLGSAKSWQHCAGNAVITDGSKVLKREVHWVQGKDGRVREAFIKEHLKNLEKRK